ncbi:protein dispatched homolog 3-like [Actinia tenebrosa]|uniref:Protein dispatched homolog 3-like n=1 Tax=Actinia tenebrosa TaxID=6105 RepID=A0A6P8HS62_ACTTE|nr:protein dispatched homolog 3-like [Actinia tenebrosa]
MPQRARHSRQKSDDFKLLEGPDIELDGVHSGSFSDSPSLSFRQPKLSCLANLRRAKTVLEGRVQKLTRRIPVNLTILSIIVLSLSLLIPVFLGLVTIFKYPTVVDISLQSFQIPSQAASEHQDAFTVAKQRSHDYKLRVRRSAEPWPIPPTDSPTSSSSGYKYTQSKSRWNIDLIYIAQGEDKNMFTTERLKTAQKIEQQIMKFKGFQDFCWKWNIAKLDPVLSTRYNACTPPVSLVDFFFPSRFGRMSFYDGQGETLTTSSMHKTLKFLLTKKFTYWFVDGNFSSENRRSSLLRAQIKFGFPLKGYNLHDYKGKKAEEQDTLYTNFMVKFIEFLKTTSTDKVKVLYGGPEVFDYLVSKTMWSDVNKAKYTLIIIIIFVFILTSFSLFLTFFGMLSILLSLPCAYFVFRVIFAIPNVTILSGASLFIIIGIGVDDVFVFINTFVHAKKSQDIKSRLMHTISTAGGSTFFTSFTTAAAFGANCLSKMPAIHDFGLFMMLIVISCWLTVILIIPPTLFLWYQYIHKLEKRLFRFLFGWIPLNCCKTQSELPGDIQRFLSGNEPSARVSHPPPVTDDVPPIELTDDVSNLPLNNNSLSLDDSLADIGGPNSDDSDLLCLSDDAQDSDSAPLLGDENTHQPQENTEDTSEQSWLCGTSLQLCLFSYAKPVHLFRFGLLLLYIIVLAGSVFLDTKITPSDKPPSFFKEGSNLQQLLDLKYNMSGDNYDCKICDDIVEVASNFINGPPTAKPVHSEKPITLPSDVFTTQKPYSPKSKRPSTVPFVLPTNAPKSTLKTTLRTSRPTTRQRQTSFPSANNKSSAITRPSTKVDVPKTTGKPTTAGNGIPMKTSAVTDEETNDIKTKPAELPTLPGGEPFDPCFNTNCTDVVDKPILDSMVTVSLVFGIKNIDRSQVVRQHVLQGKGSVIMDPKFTGLIYNHRSLFIKHMCRICNAFANNKELVRDAGADCFPDWLMTKIRQHYQSTSECKGVRSHTKLNGKSSAHLYYIKANQRIYQNSSTAFWFVMSFESTISKGLSSREMVKMYHKWDSFLKTQVQDVAELQSAFHTSSDWVHMYMEIVAVNGAIYGIVFSLVLCTAAVIIFTGHLVLSFIVILTILGVLCFVVAIFYLLGWHLGAIEAISLSILVGTSVDYCVHLVDGYIISGRFLPDTRMSNKDLRGWRTAAAVSHIGSSILSSAMTTIAASIPLCLTTIQLFSKFGQILAINTAVSIFYTLTFCMALLAVMAPSRFRRSLKSRLKALIGVAIFMGLACLCMYIVSLKGTPIPGPGGSPLFDV